METDYRIIILAVFPCLVFGDTKNYILNRLRGYERFENKAVRSVSAISLEFRRFIHGGNVNEVRFHIKKGRARRTRRLSETRLEGNLTRRSINKRKNVSRMKNRVAIPSGEEERKFVREYVF